MTATKVTMSADPHPSAKKNAPCAGTNSSGSSSPRLGEVNAVFPPPVVTISVATCTAVEPEPLYDGCNTKVLSFLWSSSGRDRGGEGGWAAGCGTCCCWPGGNSSIRLVSSEPSLPNIFQKLKDAMHYRSGKFTTALKRLSTHPTISKTKI